MGENLQFEATNPPPVIMPDNLDSRAQAVRDE